jgi:N-acetylmuramoyl-L-alanine amidase
MRRRVEIIKKAGADVVVSIHLNSFSDRRRKGIQVFFGNDRSKPLASLMQNLLNEKFNLEDAGRKFSVLKTDKYILNESPCPAIIIECGFLSNPDDERNLLDDNYRHRLAQGIYEGLLLWAFGEGA